jgi:hypothetical protein
MVPATNTARYQEIWNFLHSVEINSKQSKAFIFQDNCEDCNRIIEIFKNYRITIIDLKRLDKFSKKIMTTNNISIYYLNMIKQDNLFLEKLYINQFRNNNINFFNKGKTYRASWEHLNYAHHFQSSIALTGYIYAPCPISGKICRSDRSIYLQWTQNNPIILYRFIGTEVFYIGTGAWYGGKLFVYLPKLEFVIHIGIPPAKNMNYKQLLLNIKSIILQNKENFWNYIFNTKKKQTVNLVGFQSNLGHYFFNELTGTYWLYKTDLIRFIDKVIEGPWAKLNSKDIFPEVSNIFLKTTEKENSNFANFLFKNNYLATRITQNFITKEVADRVFTAAYRKCSSAFLEQVKSASKYFPLIWINLRKHNKVWVNQVKGYANIINSLYELYPNIAIVFDGLPDTKEEVKKINNLISNPVPVFDGTQCPMHETIVWAYVIDVYIAVIGSGLVPVTWLANKPGVAHSNLAHHDQAIWWSDVRTDLTPPKFISKQYIQDVGRGMYSNYNCNWKIIYNKIIQILNSLLNTSDLKKNQTKNLFQKGAKMKLSVSNIKLKQIQETLNEFRSFDC